MPIGTSLMAQGTGEEGFSTTGGAGDKDVFGACQIGIIGELGEGLGMEVSVIRTLDVGQGSAVTHSTGAQEEFHSPLRAMLHLGIQECSDHLMGCWVLVDRQG